MSNFDKVVKLACKPKAAAPKAKYIDPIIAATWSDDGAVHEVFKALSPRLREPNAIIVFKALIVLHTMIRNGATDNVLSYLSSNAILGLRSVSATTWDGYASPHNLQNYALYLDSRIRAYRDLKHDAVRVQAESNRDMRSSASAEEEGYRGRKDRSIKGSASAPARSKTIMGRKLRSMTVEKGLLRETKAVHSMIDALVECRFYLDDLEDELTITALRMLVKDLLILFQAGNEGVINVLEHYFEMSRVDAAEALKIYRHFCKQTEHVVEYLGVAKKLQNLLNVSIPNLRHAPVSLAGALQEYLDDPNFEQNRIEYRTNKEATERGNKTNGTAGASSTSDGKPSSPTKVAFASGSKETSSSAPRANKQDGKDVQDFFSAIEEEQPTMFNPNTNSPSVTYFQQQGASNPFAQMAMATGQPFMQQAQISAQPTGFIMPQATAMPQQSNPFGNFLAPQVPHQTGHRPFSAYIQPQQTGFIQLQPQQLQANGFAPQQPQPMVFSQQTHQAGLLQPQVTGANPFRQSVLVPQTTGAALFSGANVQNQLSSQILPLPTQNGATSAPFMNGAASFSSQSQGPLSASAFTAPKPSFFGSTGPNGTPARPASTPLSSSTAASSFSLQPVKTHVTGTKNPFGPIAITAPPVPKPPTLFELSMGGLNLNSNHQQQQQQQQQHQLQQQQQQQQPQQQQQFTGFNNLTFGNSALSPGGTDISSVASSFAFANNPKTTDAGTGDGSVLSQNTSNTTATTTTNPTGSTFSSSLFSSSLYTQPTGTTNSSQPSTQNSTAAPVKSHLTGFVGLKPFKPSSSFGASLMESLPSVAGPTSPSVSGLPSTIGTAASTPINGVGSSTNISHMGSSFSPQSGASSNSYSFLNTQPTGTTGGFGGGTGKSTLGVDLRPQITGGGAANPFRASMAAGLSMPGGAPNFGTSPFSFQSSPAGMPPFGANMMGNPQQPQQNTTNSLI